jgi:hypothetical protein
MSNQESRTDREILDDFDACIECRQKSEAEAEQGGRA